MSEPTLKMPSPLALRARWGYNLSNGRESDPAEEEAPMYQDETTDRAAEDYAQAVPGHQMSGRAVRGYGRLVTCECGWEAATTDRVIQHEAIVRALIGPQPTPASASVGSTKDPWGTGVAPAPF